MAKNVKLKLRAVEFSIGNLAGLSPADRARLLELGLKTLLVNEASAARHGVLVAGGDGEVAARARVAKIITELGLTYTVG